MKVKNEIEIEIDGIVTVPEGIDADKFSDEFIDWIKSKGYSFGGSIGPVMISMPKDAE